MKNLISGYICFWSVLTSCSTISGSWHLWAQHTFRSHISGVLPAIDICFLGLNQWPHFVLQPRYFLWWNHVAFLLGNGARLVWCDPPLSFMKPCGAFLMLKLAFWALALTKSKCLKRAAAKRLVKRQFIHNVQRPQPGSRAACYSSQGRNYTSL